MSETLYEKYGGFTTISNIVHSFYEKVLETDSLLHYFKGIDMERLARHQTDFLTLVFGGPVNYTSDRLREAHAKLRIPVADFECVADLLEESLEEADVEDEDIEAIMEVIAASKGDIVSA